MEKSYKEYLNDINTFIFDVDGVFTNGSLLIDNDGNLLRTMNVKDGYAVKIALNKGYNVCIITGGQNEAVKIRLSTLGITDIYMNSHDKVVAFEDYASKKNITPEQARIGLATCPQDAVAEVKAVSKYISHVKGGKGCVRDVIEQVLKVQDNWPVTEERSITSA